MLIKIQGRKMKLQNLEFTTNNFYFQVHKNIIHLNLNSKKEVSIIEKTKKPKYH